jgi:hypothetical protein
MTRVATSMVARMASLPERSQNDCLPSLTGESCIPAVDVACCAATAARVGPPLFDGMLHRGVRLADPFQNAPAPSPVARTEK